jgi:hypothetical protein
MQRITKIAIALIVISAILDLATTEYLFAVAQVRKGEFIIVFYEKNMFFHMLGHVGFILSFIAGTAVIAYALFRYDKLCVEHGSYTVLTFGCIAVILAFAVLHIFFGYSNLQLIKQYLL